MGLFKRKQKQKESVPAETLALEELRVAAQALRPSTQQKEKQSESTVSAELAALEEKEYIEPLRCETVKEIQDAAEKFTPPLCLEYPKQPECPTVNSDKDSALETCIEILHSMQQPDFQAQMRKAAKCNAEIVSHNTQVLNRYKADNPSHTVYARERQKLYEDLYILPEEIAGYNEKITLITSIFQELHAADVRVTGAEELDLELPNYVRKYREALWNGQKCKADIVCELLEYVGQVVNGKEPNGRTPENNRKIIEHRKTVVKNMGVAAVMMADKIYCYLFDLTKAEEKYAEDKSAFDAKYEELRIIPQAYQEEMNALKFQGVLEKYPIGHPIRQSVDIAIETAALLFSTLLSELYVKHSIINRQKLCRDLHMIRNEIQKCFHTQGEDYDDDFVLREVAKISNAILSDTQAMMNRQFGAYELNKEVASRVDALAQKSSDFSETARPSFQNRSGFDGESTTMESLLSSLKLMQTQAFQEKMRKAAEEAEQVESDNDYLKLIAEDNALFAERIRERKQLEDGIYILPKDLTDYQKKINIIISIFEGLSTSPTRVTGAEEIDRFLCYYIRKFQDALEQGQKCMADLLWKLFRYVFQVVNRKEPDSITPEVNQRILSQRRDTVQNLFFAAVMVVDKMYGNFRKLSLEEEMYYHYKEQFDAQNQKLVDMPPEYQDDIDCLSFSGVMDKYPVGHPIRAFVDIVIEAANTLTVIQLHELQVEWLKADIIELRRKLDMLSHEIDLRFCTQGNDYDDALVEAQLSRISDRIQAEGKTSDDTP